MFDRLVYVLLLDDHVVYYAAATGRRRIQRLTVRSLTGAGSSNSGTSSVEAGDELLTVEVQVLASSQQVGEGGRLTLMVPAAATLEDVTRYALLDAEPSTPLHVASPSVATGSTHTKERKRSFFSIFTPFFGGSDKKEASSRERDSRNKDAPIRLIGRDDAFFSQLAALTSSAPSSSNSPSPNRASSARSAPKNSDSDSEAEPLQPQATPTKGQPSISSVPPTPPALLSAEERSERGEATGRIRVARRQAGDGSSLVVTSLHAAMNKRLVDVFTGPEISRASFSGGRTPLRLYLYRMDDAKLLKIVHVDAVVITEALQRYLGALAVAHHDNHNLLGDISSDFRQTVPR